MSYYYAGIGSQSTPDFVCKRMTQIAKRLYQLGFTLRSGGARGADQAFEEGAFERKEIYRPLYTPDPLPLGHIRLDGAILDEAMQLASTIHPAWRWIKSDRVKQLHARNGFQVLGPELLDPVEFVLCWTKDGAIDKTSKDTGGTGQAIRIAVKHNIPVYNLFHDDAMEHLKLHLRQLKLI